MDAGRESGFLISEELNGQARRTWLERIRSQIETNSHWVEASQISPKKAPYVANPNATNEEISKAA